MKARLLTLALALLTAINVLANVNVRTNGSPVQPGTVLHLSWQRPSPTQSSDVDVSYDGGSTWEEIAAGLEQDTLLWKIPAVKFEEVRFRVRLARPIQSTYQIPTSYRRPGSTTSKAWSPGGDTLFTIEATDSTCMILRTDLVNGRTDCLWGTATSSTNGVISNSLRYAFVALKGGDVFRIDLTSGQSTKLAIKANRIAIVDEHRSIAVIDSRNYLHLIDYNGLSTIRSWNLGYFTTVNTMFECGGRIIITNQQEQSLIFQIDRAYAFWLNTVLMPLGTSDSLMCTTDSIYHIRDLATTCPLPPASKVIAVSTNERYVLTKVVQGGAYVETWLVDLRSTTRVRLPQNIHHSTGRIFVSDADSCLLISHDDRSLLVKLRDNSADTLLKLDYALTELLSNGDHGYVSESVVSTFRHGKIRYSFQTPVVTRISPSPDGRHAVAEVNGRLVLYDRKTNDFHQITDLTGSGFFCAWSTDGDSALISNGRTLGIFRPLTREFFSKYTTQPTGTIKRVFAGSNLRVACFIVNDYETEIWSAGNNNIRTIPIQKIARIMDVTIVPSSAMILIRALPSTSNNQKLWRCSIDNVDDVTEFAYGVSAAQRPYNLQAHVVDERSNTLITRETVTTGVIRISSWSLTGEQRWSKLISIDHSNTYGPQILSATERFLLRTANQDRLYDLKNGELLFDTKQRVLSEVGSGNAYISCGESPTQVGGAAVSVSSLSLNEHILIKDSIKSTKGVAYSFGSVFFSSDTAWVVITNPDALLPSDSVLYSDVLQRSIITHVSLSDAAIDIQANVREQPPNCTIKIFDILGRLLFEQNNVFIQNGITSIYVGDQSMPRHVLLQIASDRAIQFSGIVQR